jgi:hypothetical protein
VWTQSLSCCSWRTVVTIVRIVLADPRTGSPPDGSAVNGQQLIVLADTVPAEDGGRRAAVTAVDIEPAAPSPSAATCAPPTSPTAPDWCSAFPAKDGDRPHRIRGTIPRTTSPSSAEPATGPATRSLPRCSRSAGRGPQPAEAAVMRTQRTANEPTRSHSRAVHQPPSSPAPTPKCNKNSRRHLLYRGGAGHMLCVTAHVVGTKCVGRER